MTTDPVECDDNVGPITISIARKVVPGREQDYEDWLHGAAAVVREFPGHMGVDVIRPTRGSREYVTIFRFDTYAHRRNWDESDVRRQWLERLDGIVEGEDEVRVGTGLEFWFSLPELPTVAPSPHKMAFVLFIVVFSLLLPLSALANALLGDWPPPLRMLITVLIQVALMTYVVMPRVTKLLKNWLYD